MTYPSREGGAVVPLRHEAVLEAVAAIRAAGVLGRSPRRARLLDYLIDRELSGHGEDIKPHAIAVEVFDRDQRFDPGRDSIVRTEIGRLREALARFYALADPELPVIEIPRGSCRPTLRPGPGESGPPPSPWPRRFVALAGLAMLIVIVPMLWQAHVRHAQERVFAAAARPIEEAPYRVLRVAVLPFRAEGRLAGIEDLAYGFGAEIATDLAAHPWIATSAPRDAARAAETADYLLRGRLMWRRDTLLAQLELISFPGRRTVWTTFQRVGDSAGALQETERTVLGQIVRRLGAAHRVSPELMRAPPQRYAESDLPDLSCLMGIHRYLAAPAAPSHAALSSCLGRVVDSHPRYGEAWAALALLRLDEARFGRNLRSGPGAVASAWGDAARATSQALRLAPQGLMTLHAAAGLALEGPGRDTAAFQAHAARLLELYPHHPPSLALVGSGLAAHEGRWDEGLALVAQALRLEPDAPGRFHVAPALKALMGADDAAVSAAVASLDPAGSRIERLLVALARARLSAGAPAGPSAAPAPNATATDALPVLAGTFDRAEAEAFVRGRRYTPGLETALLRQIAAADPVPATTAALP
ncbi:hypothetical protein [Rhodovulum visakhapatnamense]|uniref:TolB-like protein n=2 Tax=Rhodovulum visakhapatnamense TaxID=364297 RepID=A0ABS1REK8_9RHOB|nr:hypothetical protein [Rhodovulum visakhapatnamense]MBL3578077.1 hypothetical protein [Rhodovulum visakhapatnamense]